MPIHSLHYVGTFFNVSQSIIDTFHENKNLTIVCRIDVVIVNFENEMRSSDPGTKHYLGYTISEKYHHKGETSRFHLDVTVKNKLLPSSKLWQFVPIKMLYIRNYVHNRWELIQLSPLPIHSLHQVGTVFNYSCVNHNWQLPLKQ